MGPPGRSGITRPMLRAGTATASSTLGRRALRAQHDGLGSIELPFAHRGVGERPQLHRQRIRGDHELHHGRVHNFLFRRYSYSEGTGLDLQARTRHSSERPQRIPFRDLGTGVCSLDTQHSLLSVVIGIPDAQPIDDLHRRHRPQRDQRVSGDDDDQQGGRGALPASIQVNPGKYP